MKAYDIYKNFFLSFIFLIFIFGMSIDYFSEVYTKVTAPVTEEKVIYTEEFEKLNPTINSETNTKLSLIGKYKKTWKDFSSALTASPTDLTINKFVLTVNTHFCNTAGMSYIPGTTFIKLDNGTLLSTGNDSFNSQKMDTQMNYLNNFMQTLKEKSINYVYIDCPNKDEILGDKRPLGFRSTSKKEEKEYMFKSFEVNDIPSLRLGEKMIQTENDANNMFYKTDHHWKTEFGIDAAFHIAEYLNTEFDYKIDTKIFNRSNYTPVTYEDCLLGSTGINSTIY